MRRRLYLSLACLLLFGGSSLAQQPPDAAKVLTVAPAQPIKSFDALWADYKRTAGGGDDDARTTALENIRWFQMERNIRRLDTFALAAVARGHDLLKKGDRERAKQELAAAVALDPCSPDAYYGMAAAEMQAGPVGYLLAVPDLTRAVLARLPTAEGRYALMVFAFAVGILTLTATVAVYAVALLTRHGALLLHDIEEALGVGSRTVALGVLVVFLLVPLMMLQGYGWLPLWWLALLFVYMDKLEKVLSLAFLALALTVAPWSGIVEGYVLAEQNPLLRAGLVTLESGPDERAISDLEEAVRQYPDDRDFKYLLAMQYKKAARHDDAGGIYRAILAEDKDDVIAQNNLGNLHFAQDAADEYVRAATWYKKAIELPASAAVKATLYYNLSLAHLQHFDYDPGAEARNEADQIDRSLVKGHEETWKAEKIGAKVPTQVATVVDLGPTEDEVWSKFLRPQESEAVARKNVTGKGGSLWQASGPHPLLNRFTAFALVCGLVVLGLARWRGQKAFTMRCAKCGAPFCKRCQLTAAVVGLCTQCHHLFVVRDGVSGPARNQKMLEVQDEDRRRNRVFRLLSLCAPGAGQIFGQKPLLGLGFSFVWHLLIASFIVAKFVISPTDAPGRLAGPWGPMLTVILLVAVYVAANRAVPAFDFIIPAQQRPVRRTLKAS